MNVFIEHGQLCPLPGMSSPYCDSGEMSVQLAAEHNDTFFGETLKKEKYCKTQNNMGMEMVIYIYLLVVDCDLPYF